MGRIVTIANQKGGVGKTTTAVNLAASLAAAEKRTLVVDLDPQGNAGSALGIPRHEVEGSVYDVLLDGRPAREVVRRTELKFLDLLPASRHLVGAELELATLERREYRLRDALAGVAADYEFLVVDCPPSLGLLTLNGLVAAQGVIIPLQCEYFAAAARAETTLATGGLTGEGRILGPVSYMSPEQAQGKHVDTRSDIFSLGVILHQMATGEQPFAGDTPVSVISSILKDTPTSVTDLKPALPADLARIVRRCLAKDPERRYQTPRTCGPNSRS